MINNKINQINTLILYKLFNICWTKSNNLNTIVLKTYFEFLKGKPLSLETVDETLRLVDIFEDLIQEIKAQLNFYKQILEAIGYEKKEETKNCIPKTEGNTP